MSSNEGYIQCSSSYAKVLDPAISGNWSYNPTHFDNNEVSYECYVTRYVNYHKLGWKTSYYPKHLRSKQDPSENEEDIKTEISNTFESN